MEEARSAKRWIQWNNNVLSLQADILQVHITQPLMSLPTHKIENRSGITSFLSAKVQNQQVS